MKINIKTSLLVSLLVVSISVTGFAKEGPRVSVKRIPAAGHKAADCAPASQIAQMEFNNVRARIENGGNMWQNRSNGTPAYEIPKGSGLRSLYAGALWMGGVDENFNIKLAAVTFRTTGNDFWPGPLTNDGQATVDPGTCEEYDRFYKAYKPDAIRHKAYWDMRHELEVAGEDVAAKLNEMFPGYNSEGPAYFKDWPAHGGPNQDYMLAPFVDNPYSGTPNFYEPHEGDYPGYDLLGEIKCRDQTRRVPLFGDTTIYWIFNDKGNPHTETGSLEIGMEIRAQAFAFADKSAINNMTFYNYVLINQGSEILQNTYFGQWADSDLGNPNDDYVGCDVARGLGYCYNGDNEDEVNGGPSPGYGSTPPAVGIDFFQGPFQDSDGIDNPGPYDSIFSPSGIKGITYQQAKDGNGIPYRGIGIGYGDGIPDNERFGMTKFLYYNIGTGVTNDPSTTSDYYNYLQGIWKDGTQFIYGGNAHQSTIGSDPPRSAIPGAICNYMFPGESDSLGWGTQGITSYPIWTEQTAGNQPNDRRFMQSSGPFTLTPGQVNNITVGVVWARAAAGSATESVKEMLRADDIAQGLFDNCFQIFEGPDAPDVNITELDRELILFLENPTSSNNAGEAYKAERVELPPDVDRTYRFEGYQIFQVKDATVSVADLSDITKARLAFQRDIKNFNTDPFGRIIPNSPIAQLVNYEFDPVMKKPVPVLKVNGENQGIENSFRVTKDLFATGSDQRLVNNRPYYFIAIAYAYNNYMTFDPDPIQPKGQAEMYVASRKNGRGGAIFSYSGIPHKTEVEKNGTVLNSEYGLMLPVTRLEGTGNGNFFIDMKQESEDRIMAGSPWAIQEINYEEGASPIRVKIVDPLKVKEAEFELRLIDTTITTPNPQNVSTYMDRAHWELKNLADNDITFSNRSIRAGGEQLVLKYGISIEVEQHFYTGKATKEITEVVGSAIIPANSWLGGFEDTDAQNFTNWIRAGNVFSGSDFNDEQEHADESESFEKLLNGTWAPYILTSDTTGGPRNEVNLTIPTDRTLRIANTNSVDIVFTSDKSKWTRCPVIEMHEDNTLTEGFSRKGFIRRAPSVDKNGRTVGEPGFNAEEGTLVSESGMSWFPGYAINVETGERLNMSFGEDSWFVNDNGRDMIWNPTSNQYNNDPVYNGDSVVFGGRHYVFVHKNVQATNRQYNAKDVGGYDEGLTLYKLLSTSTPTTVNNPDYQRFLASQSWVGLTKMNPGFEFKSMADGLVPNDVRIKLRVAKRYEAYIGGGKTYADTVTSRNNFNPMYTFNTKGYAVERGVVEVGKSGLDLIRAVPNPYYAYSSYESDRLDNRIKITNLPEQCTISIYSVDGTLIKNFTRDTRGSTRPETIQEWDLKNFANIPVASGVYIIHVNAPGLGEKVIKWFGVMRQIDLQNL